MKSFILFSIALSFLSSLAMAETVKFKIAYSVDETILLQNGSTTNQGGTGSNFQVVSLELKEFQSRGPACGPGSCPSKGIWTDTKLIDGVTFSFEVIVFKRALNGPPQTPPYTTTVGISNSSDPRQAVRLTLTGQPEKLTPFDISSAGEVDVADDQGIHKLRPSFHFKN